MSTPVRFQADAATLCDAVARAGVRLPWPPATSCPRLDGVLPEANLDGLAPWARAFVAGGRQVDLTLVVAHPAGISTLCSWQRVHGDEVLSLTAASTNSAEIACYPRRLWAGELTRLVTPPNFCEGMLVAQSGAAGSAGAAWVLDDTQWWEVGRDGTRRESASTSQVVARIHEVAP
jgi:hypothetical protein